MTIVIHGATVATVDADDTVIYDGAVAVGDDRILSVGQSGEVLARYPQAEQIDATGKAIMPGFANVHTHLLHDPGARHLRGSVAAASAAVHQRPGATADARARPRRASAIFCQLGVLEAIRSGTTAILEDATGHRDLRRGSGRNRRALPVDGAGLGQGQRLDRRPVAVRGRPQARRALPRPHRGPARQAPRGMADGRIRIGVSAWAPTCARPSSCATSAPCSTSSIPSPRSTSTRSGARSPPCKTAARPLARPSILDDLGFLNDRLDCRALPLHGAAGGEASWAGQGHGLLQLRDRGAARAQPAHRRPRSVWLSASPWAPTTWRRTWSRSLRTGSVHGTGAAPGRPATQRPSRCIAGRRVNGYRAIGRCRWRRARSRQQGRSHHDRLAATASGAGAARGLRLRASRTGSRRRGGRWWMAAGSCAAARC